MFEVRLYWNWILSRVENLGEQVTHFLLLCLLCRCVNRNISCAFIMWVRGVFVVELMVLTNTSKASGLKTLGLTKLVKLNFITFQNRNRPPRFSNRHPWQLSHQVAFTLATSSSFSLLGWLTLCSRQHSGGFHFRGRQPFSLFFEMTLTLLEVALSVT